MKRNRQDRLGKALFGVVAFALAASLLVQAKLGERHRRIEREDVDPRMVESRSTLILLDVTDPLGDAQVDAVRARVGTLEEFELERGEVVGVSSVGQYEDGDVRSWFHAGYPGRTVNALIETASRRAARVDSIFSRPLRAALDQALRPSTARRTGLSAAIREAGELDGFASSIPRRRLVLVSDLMENSPGFSMYTAPLDSTLKAPPGWLRDHQADLRGVGVEVLEVPRLNLESSERSAVRSFWAEYFRACGATSVRFQRLP